MSHKTLNYILCFLQTSPVNVISIFNDFSLSAVEWQRWLMVFVNLWLLIALPRWKEVVIVCWWLYFFVSWKKWITFTLGTSWHNQKNKMISSQWLSRKISKIISSNISVSKFLVFWFYMYFISKFYLYCLFGE